MAIDSFGVAFTTSKSTLYDRTVDLRHDIYGWRIEPSGANAKIFLNGNAVQDRTIPDGGYWEPIFAHFDSCRKIEIQAASGSGTVNCFPIFYG